MAKVLLTGGSGFLASHILDILLDQGRAIDQLISFKLTSNLPSSFHTVVTVRSDDKGQRILDALPPVHHAKFSFTVVPDISSTGAFDEALTSHGPLDFIIHAASPYHFNISNPITDILSPAVVGTLNLLHAIPIHAPSVKRVILTSSSATILNPSNHAKVYDESVYGETSWTEAMNPRSCYRASKIYAERAAFAFTSTPSPTFTLTTINPPLLFGPPARHLPSLSSLNTSNQRILSALHSTPQQKILLGPTGPVYIFCDVRDAALAHVRALQASDGDVDGKRFFVVGGYFSNRGIERVVRGIGGVEKTDDDDDGDDIPVERERYGYDNSRSRDILGLRYRGLAETVEDTVKALRLLEVSGGTA